MLKGEKVFLRAMEPLDLSVLYKWENNTEHWKYSNTTLPYSKSLLKQFIENSSNDIFVDKQVRFMICEVETEKPVGTMDLFDFDPINMRAGVGILIADNEDRRKGYARESIQLAIDFSFKKLRLHQLFCDITSDNENSIKLFQSLGFIISGTKKQWRNIEGNWEDEHFLQLIND